jgi:hypothetical protein
MGATLMAMIDRLGLVEKVKVAAGLIALVALVGATGCGGIIDFDGGNGSPKKKQVAGKEDDAKPRTVVVNKGMSKKEENKLNKRLDELEKKVEAEGKQGSKDTKVGSQPEQAEQQAEDGVRAAAEAYYQAAVARDWGYTYNHLDSETQDAYTENEWFAKNDWLANNGSATYTIEPVEMDDSSGGSVANVAVLLTFEDGSTSLRNTYFVYEDGSWKHRFGAEEYELFATAGTASASATAGSSPDASASPDAAGTKHIEVVISSNVPVDVFISDDNFDWLQQEEITGTKTYEHDIDSDSGLTVSATNPNLRGDVTIEVYEDGTLKSQDSDSTGLAQIVY